MKFIYNDYRLSVFPIIEVTPFLPDNKIRLQHVCVNSSAIPNDQVLDPYDISARDLVNETNAHIKITVSL